MFVIQAPKGVWHAPIRFDRRAVGQDGAACLGKPTDPGRSGDNCVFLEAVLWIARTGSPWRDLPPTLGNWNTVFKRYRDWAKAGVFNRIFDAVSDDPDMEFAMVDATIVKVHRHARGAKWDPKSGARQVEGRLDRQNPRADRRALATASIPSASRP
jgi:transposase